MILQLLELLLSPTHLLYQLSTNIRTNALQLVFRALVGGRLVLEGHVKGFINLAEVKID